MLSLSHTHPDKLNDSGACLTRLTSASPPSIHPTNMQPRLPRPRPDAEYFAIWQRNDNKLQKINSYTRATAAQEATGSWQEEEREKERELERRPPVDSW